MNNKDYLSVAEIARQITVLGSVKGAKLGETAAVDYGRIICANYGSDPIAIDLAMANLPLELKGYFLKGYQELAEKALNVRIAEAEAEISRFELMRDGISLQTA